MSPEARVEEAIRSVVGDKPVRSLLDLGAGTGRMLELFAPQAERAVGVDLSSAMLGVARGRLEETGLRNVQLRQGDIYALPIERNSIDLAIMHQVLHYLDDPARALREAARVLAPGGRLLVVDFAPHQEETLRDKHAHRRLGFSDAEIDRPADAGGTRTSFSVANWRPTPTKAPSSPCPCGWRAIRASSPIPFPPHLMRQPDV